LHWQERNYLVEHILYRRIKDNLNTHSHY
jgi:hypothetical protein